MSMAVTRSVGVAFEQVRRLAARRDAGVEHARAGRGRECVGHALRGCVLYRHRAVVEPRQRGHRHRRRQSQCVGQRLIGVRLDAGLRQLRGVLVAGRALAVHAQPHRRLGGARIEHGVGFVGPVAGDALAQPLGPVRVRVARRNAIALGAAKQRVDQSGLVRATQRARGVHGRGKRGVRGQSQRIELGHAGEQQRFQFSVATRQRLAHPRLQSGIEARRLAQHGEADRLDQRAVARIGQCRQRLRELGLERTAAVQHRV